MPHPHAPPPLRQILNSTAAPPHDLYRPFLARLAGTVRDDIADCAAAYGSLSVGEAAGMLRLAGGEGELAAYVASRGLPWTIAAGRVSFVAQDKARPLMEASALLANTLGYAAELEKIV